MGRLRAGLDGLFSAERPGGGTALAEGMVPPAGVRRAGARLPALGRGQVASAAAERTRDLERQTAAFVRDPRGALPHYPRWDGNRGFGP